MKVLESHPLIYSATRGSTYFNPWIIFRWLLWGFIDSCICFFITFYAYDSSPDQPGGEVTGFVGTGLVVFTCVVTVVNLKLFFFVRSWTWVHVLAFAISFITYWVATVIFNSSSVFALGGIDYYGVLTFVGQQGKFWLTILICVGTSIMVNMIYISLWETFFPRSPIQIYYEAAALGMDLDQVDQQYRQYQGQLRNSKGTSESDYHHRRDHNDKDIDSRVRSRPNASTSGQVGQSHHPHMHATDDISYNDGGHFVILPNDSSIQSTTSHPLDHHGKLNRIDSHLDEPINNRNTSVDTDRTPRSVHFHIMTPSTVTGQPWDDKKSTAVPLLMQDHHQDAIAAHLPGPALSRTNSGTGVPPLESLRISSLPTPSRTLHSPHWTGFSFNHTPIGRLRTIPSPVQPTKERLTQTRDEEWKEEK